MSLAGGIEGFSRSNLRSVSTVVTRQNGDKYLETKDAVEKLIPLPEEPSQVLGTFFVVDNTPDEGLYKVLSNVFIGSQDAAANKVGLAASGITHILNVAIGIEDNFPSDFAYLDKPVYDIPEFDIKACFDECCAFIEDAIRQGSVLVHCNAGVSRSATIIIAYLIKQHKMSYDDAYTLVKSARPSIKPNDGFVKQLKEYQELVTKNQ